MTTNLRKSIMKNIIILLILGLSLSLNAQKKDRHEHIKALKVPFLTEELELTPAEAEKFWPIYNVYDNAMNDLRTRERDLFQEKFSESGSKNNLSETEAKKLMTEYNDIIKRKYQLESELMNNLTQKLPASKMVFLPEAEHKFGKKLWEEYKKRKNNK
ncbi:hypothetical protein SAMN02745246_03391 [Leeuwenhoekiella marinoflava DSM 3653]|uniref:Sensor of ECF-type sigma factor n=3 Tax=Leeuwenhoekiella marinoflava TaxID=988 RepID=A0A4Q0PJ09_9FLAO|nr:hypothetical protein DSL99_2995 [Leeuwenhoekiella marinoflava]SHF78573.1 hypothetical protein SAMN02745246_03391 [Leeuwenhoekiella marinoflava DSM 3653]